MAKLDNILAILWMLRSDEKITAQQIAEELEMNIRTVYRYIDTLSMSGVPIISDVGHHGGYTLLHEFIEVPLFFAAEEQTALFHAGTFAEEAGYYGGEALKKALMKLKRYSNEEQETKISQQVTNLEVIGRLNSQTQLPRLKELEQAITEKSAIKILYYRRHEGKSSYRLLNPYKIIYWHNKWYVIGYCHLRDTIRSFRVDRIEDLKQTEYLFEQPANFLVQDYFMKDAAPTLGIEEEKVSLIIGGDKKALGDLCQHWFLGKYLSEWKDNQATFILEEELIYQYVPHLLFPYGQSIRVIEPLGLKQRLVEVLSELIQFHQL